MTDIFTKEKRSEVMSRIRSRDTKPEIVLRSMLHRMGYRFRTCQRNLPGTPDVVMPGRRTVIQARGCFWHDHDCRKRRPVASNPSYWERKLAANVARDARQDAELRGMGWRVVVVWECELKKRNIPILEARLRTEIGQKGERA